jgi:hypothetical protein
VPRVSSFELPISASHIHLLRVLPVVGCRSKTPTGCDLVIWSGILERDVDPRGVDLGGVSLPEVLTSLHILLTLNVASLLCLSLLQPK